MEDARDADCRRASATEGLGPCGLIITLRGEVANELALDRMPCGVIVPDVEIGVPAERVSYPSTVSSSSTATSCSLSCAEDKVEWECREPASRAISTSSSAHVCFVRTFGITCLNSFSLKPEELPSLVQDPSVESSGSDSTAGK